MSSWAQRLPTSPGPNMFFEPFPDLHLSKTSSSAVNSHSPKSKQQPRQLQPSSPSARPSPRTLRLNTFSLSRSTSAPTSPLLNASAPSKSASGTDLVSPSNTTNAPPSRPQRRFSAYSTKTDPITLKNPVSPSLLASPTPRSFAGNGAYSSATTQHPQTQSGINEPLVKGYPSTTRSNSYGGPSMPGVITMTKSNGGNASKRPQAPDQMQHFYQPFSNTNMMFPPRSISFSGSPVNRHASPIGPSPTLPAELPSSHLLLSDNSTGHQTIGSKSTKKGIKNRLRRFRRKQGSSSRDVSAYITSGESDYEAAFDPEPDTMFNTGGIVHRFAPSVGGSSKSSASSRPKINYNDSSLSPQLPPQLPPRNLHINTTPSYNNTNTASGQGKGWLSGSEHGTEPSKESSTVRLKGLLKSVGLSNQHSTGQAPNTPATPDQLKPVQSRSTFPLFGDFLSGDDQPVSKVFSLKHPERRKKKRWAKKSRSAAAGTHVVPTAVTDDEDSSASRSGRHNHHNQHSHHRLLQHLHPGRRSRSIDRGSAHNPAITPKQEPIMSNALKEAREANRDPNVLIVELEPLPGNSQNSVAELPSKTSYQLNHYHQQYPLHLLYGPLSSYAAPSSIAGSTLTSGYCAPIGTSTNYQGNITPYRPAAAKYSNTIVTKTFLFMSHENSKFQAHYIFRVVGNNVEYKKLPVALEQLCSQYFREAYVAYRTLEQKAKSLKEDLERRRTNHFWARNPDFEDRIDQTGPLTVNIPKSTKDHGHKGSELERRYSENNVLKSAVAWDQMKSTNSAGLTESPVVTPTSAASRTAGYLDQRYNLQTSNNATLRGIVGVPDRSRSDPAEKNSAADFNGNKSKGAGGSVSFQPTPRSAFYHSRRRSWSSIKEQQLSEQHKQQEIEEANWREMERKHREEFQQITYGLDLFLAELVKGSEYDIFDTVTDVTTLNDNRDNAIFHIINGDKTNKMCLESPSTKLKDEFLNWIAISAMSYEEVKDESLDLQTKLPVKSSLDFLTTASSTHQQESEGVDLMHDMVQLRIDQQCEKIQKIRRGITSTATQIDKCLGELDKKNDEAKELLTKMIRDLDSQEVQLALRPSPTTGATLADAVERKVKDVEERIRVCRIIMEAAGHDLYRLRLEIELEQRSIRLFRQYKIIIAVVTISIVFLAWFLYHSRANALGPQPPSPLFAAPINPFETDYNFHHGGPASTSSVPASTISTYESVHMFDEHESGSNHNHVVYATAEEIDIEDRGDEPEEEPSEAITTNDMLNQEELAKFDQVSVQTTLYKTKDLSS
ncbi:hypothetical protein BGX27_001958 [Mortierella sp. AM989]|nr:hypothetical protein BGX27_001958 [Mortierella sp. AM989]